MALTKSSRHCRMTKETLQPPESMTEEKEHPTTSDEAVDRAAHGSAICDAKLDRFLRSREGRRLVAETKRRQKEETQLAHERFQQMMRGGCHDCQRNAKHAMRIWDDEAKPGLMVAVCSECGGKRVTADIVKGIGEDRPYEPEDVFVEFSPNAKPSDSAEETK